MLYNLQQQGLENRRKDKLADAQANWYNTREEMARDKAELEKMKAVRVIKNTDGSLAKYDPVSGTIEKLTEKDPLYDEYMRSKINRNNRAGTGGGSRGNGGNQGTYGYQTVRHRDPATGDIITTRTPTTGGKQEVRRTPAKPVKTNNKASKAKAGNKGNKSGFFNS